MEEISITDSQIKPLSLNNLTPERRGALWRRQRSAESVADHCMRVLSSKTIFRCRRGVSIRVPFVPGPALVGTTFLGGRDKGLVGMGGVRQNLDNPNDRLTIFGGGKEKNIV